MQNDIEIKFDLYSASTLVSRKPCELYSIIVVEAGADAKAVTVRDGFDSSGGAKMVLSASNYHLPVVIFREPVRFTRGLYLDLESGLDYVMVQYRPEY